MHARHGAPWRALQAGLLATALCAAALHAQPAAAPASPVQTEVTREADGTRTLRQSVVAAAPIAAVWEALSSSAGWQSWAAPFARVDLRRGGVIETSYRPDARAGDAASIRNEIIALLPPRVLAIRNVQAPPSTAFDVPTFQSLHTVVLVEPLDAQRTRITFAQPGYGEGAAFDGVLKHFTWGNAWTLEKLKERLERGPIDWAALMRPAAK
jgi:uncharacterized protein YndB with AHSA1/START domain